jgi:iron-siderophore transport system permease protein
MTTLTTSLPLRDRRALPRLAGLPLAAIALGAAVLLSLTVGAKAIPLGDVAAALVGDDGSDSAAIVRELRLPRTLVGLAVGVGLGLAGALMQALTRNPLGDPGILGVEAGAAAAIVAAITALGLKEPGTYVWFSFAGAAAASVAVYALGTRGRSGATPVRLALAGTAVTAALTAFTNAVVLLDPQAFDEFRHWAVGSLAGRDLDVLADVGPFLAAGTVLAFALARPLNALALGDDSGRALGTRVGRTRGLGALAITLLCGGATAVAGPIVFVGLMVPHIARAIAGPDQRWLLAYSALLAPVLLLTADVIGRVVVAPAELEVGIVTALIGAPVFIALVRRKRIARL